MISMDYKYSIKIINRIYFTIIIVLSILAILINISKIDVFWVELVFPYLISSLTGWLAIWTIIWMPLAIRLCMLLILWAIYLIINQVGDE